MECRHLNTQILQQPFATPHLNYNCRTSPCLLFPYTSASRSHARVTTGQLNPDTDITLRWLWLRGPLALVTTLFEKERCRLIPTWTGAGYVRDQAWAGLPPFQAGYSNKPIQALSSRGRPRREHVYTFQFRTRNYVCMKLHFHSPCPPLRCGAYTTGHLVCRFYKLTINSFFYIIIF